MQKIKVLFVCMGNICRSPTAEGVFTKLITEKNLTHCFQIDSAGTHAYHVGDPPDTRAQKFASKRGVDIKHLRGRQVTQQDFDHFDYILVMDDSNHTMVMNNCPVAHQSKVRYFLEFAPDLETREVPDPYYGAANDFERVLDMVESASLGFVNYLYDTKRLG
jgi:protein-tyrosine phosphatase